MIKPNRWLSDFAGNITSQHGEDGIIEKVLEVIGDTNKWCVEFGSWDGQYLSNTFNLIKNRAFAAVLIEGDVSRFRDLLKTYEGNSKVVPVNAFVGFEKKNGLDSLLICLDGKAQKCKFATSLGDYQICKCPLRLYIAKNLRK